MNHKKLFWIILAIILLAIIVGAIAYYHFHVAQKVLPPTQPVPVDNGTEVTSTAKAAADPLAVFRLDLKFQTPSSSLVSSTGAYASDTSVSALAYVSSSLFSSMGNLVLLNLDNDDIGTLPPEIGNLQNLQVLYLSNNQLTNLPPEIGNLKNLWMLSLFGNNLTSLPSTISQLTNLKVLGLTGNPIAQSSTAIAALQKELPDVKIISK